MVMVCVMTATMQGDADNKSMRTLVRGWGDGVCVSLLLAWTALTGWTCLSVFHFFFFNEFMKVTVKIVECGGENG